MSLFSRKIWVWFLSAFICAIVIGGSWIIYQFYFLPVPVIYGAVEINQGAKLVKKNLNTWETLNEIKLPNDFDGSKSHSFRLHDYNASTDRLFFEKDQLGIIVFNLKSREIENSIKVNGTIQRLSTAPDGNRIFINNPETVNSDAPLTWIYSLKKGTFSYKIHYPILDEYVIRKDKIWYGWPPNRISQPQNSESNMASMYLRSISKDKNLWKVNGEEKIKEKGGLHPPWKQLGYPYIYIDKSLQKKILVKTFNRNSLQLINSVDISAKFKDFGSVETSYPTDVIDDSTKLILPVTLMEQSNVNNMKIPRPYIAILDIDTLDILETYRIPKNWRGYVIATG